MNYKQTQIGHEIKLNRLVSQSRRSDLLFFVRSSPLLPFFTSPSAVPPLLGVRRAFLRFLAVREGLRKLPCSRCFSLALRRFSSEVCVRICVSSVPCLKIQELASVLFFAMAVIVATTTAEALPPDQPEPPDRLLSVGSPVLLFSTGSGLSSPASLPLLLARSFITVVAQFPGGSPFADWVGDLEARPCPTMAMTTSFRVACFFSDTSTSPPITFSQVYSPSSPSDSSTLESHQIVVDFEVLVLWNTGLDLLLVLVAFGSTFVLSCGTHIAFMRSFTAVCSFLSDFTMSMFDSVEFSFLCWRLRQGTLFIGNSLVNLVQLDFHSHHFSLKEFIILPNTSLVFSDVVIGGIVLKAVLFGAEVRMTILSHLVSTSLTIKVGLLLDSVLTLLDHLIGDSFLPCIEVSVRLALIWYVTKGFVPIFCIGISVFADVIWEVQSLFRAMLPHLGIHCLFVFPKVPLVWSGLDDQASPVLQGPSSRLAFSALVAELVTLRVALDAVSYEVFGIVLFRSHWTSFVKLYLAFISSLSSFEVFLGTSCLVILYSPFIWVVIPPPLSEFEI
ncbi:unnamed protein product [Arabidopsis lyrata]|nr:unnamed protein product [Arabidopsis lyrata]